MNQSFQRLEEAGETELTVYIGYDWREHSCAVMLAESIHRYSSRPVTVIPLIYDDLRCRGHHDRPMDPNGATAFSITRFLTPWLHTAYSNANRRDAGKWALFMDCDMLITKDIYEIIPRNNDTKPVYVCKHDYTPSTTDKMGGTAQHVYPLKNWSAVMLFDTSFNQNWVLTPDVVNTADPSFLHQFKWMQNLDQIGDLPLEWNYLVDEGLPDEYYGGIDQKFLTEKTLPANVHHTLGSPIFREQIHCGYSEYWKAEFERTFGRAYDVDRDVIN